VELVLPGVLLKASWPATPLPPLLLAITESRGLATSIVDKRVNNANTTNTEENCTFIGNVLTQIVYFICLGPYYFIWII
jgi:hypothetical protein